MTEDELQDELKRVTQMLADANQAQDTLNETTQYARAILDAQQLELTKLEVVVNGFADSIAEERAKIDAMSRDLHPRGIQSDIEICRMEILRGRDQIVSAIEALEHSKAVAAELQSRLCANCGRRPRAFDDLCKRCAQAVGTRPRGKIGTA